MHLCLCIHPPNPLSMNKSNRSNQRELMHVWMDEWMHQRMSIGSESIYISRGCGSCVGVFAYVAPPSGSSLLFRKEPGTLLSSQIKDGLHGPQVCNNPKYSCTNSKDCERLEWRLYKIVIPCDTLPYLATSYAWICMDMIGIDWMWKSQVLHHVRCIVQWRCAAWSRSSAFVHFLELRHGMPRLSA